MIPYEVPELNCTSMESEICDSLDASEAWLPKPQLHAHSSHSGLLSLHGLQDICSSLPCMHAC